jgi:hypothetical protein
MNDENRKRKKSFAPIKIEVPKNKIPALSQEGMNEIHPDLPQIPFFVAVNGPRNRGKSVLAYNILSKKEGMYGNAFKPSNIFVYSPTTHLDKTFDDLELKNRWGPDQVSVEKLISDIYSQQMKHMETDNMTGVMMLFEDITKIRQAWPHIEDLGYMGRHWHIHVWYIAHKLSSIPRGVRTATQQWIIFQPHEQSELEWIIEMFSRRRTRDCWEAAVLRAWAIPHNFVYIDFEHSEFERIYRSGFDQPLFTLEEQRQLDISMMQSPFKDPSHVEPKEWMKEFKKRRKISPK